MDELLYKEAIELLKKMINIPSFSGEENETGDLIESWLKGFNIPTNRKGNNIWAVNEYFDVSKPSILLNSHHDTVKPNKAYTNNPFDAKVVDGKLYGLGSNDAGGCLVSLMAVFIHFYNCTDLEYNIVLAATAEEENSGLSGMRFLLGDLPDLDFAIVGEPTEMKMAIAEKGLLVLDGYSSGIAGHAAHENTENAIYSAIEDINWIKDHQFSKSSDLLGEVKMNVTQIEAGQQHNLVPALCHFVVDVRVNEVYTNREVYDIINKNTKSEIVARSFDLNSSSIPLGHPIVTAGIELGRSTYGSPTLSDQALLNCPSLKLGPGVSSRSHSADEFVLLAEIDEGIELYIQLLNKIL